LQGHSARKPSWGIPMGFNPDSVVRGA
jgi:hypothetical protein